MRDGPRIPLEARTPCTIGNTRAIAPSTPSTTPATAAGTTPCSARYQPPKPSRYASPPGEHDEFRLDPAPLAQFRALPLDQRQRFRRRELAFRVHPPPLTIPEQLCNTQSTSPRKEHMSWVTL
ncbi:hypothetical protein GCM10018954_056500 [Kutzneria kofuensis]